MAFNIKVSDIKKKYPDTIIGHIVRSIEHGTDKPSLFAVIDNCYYGDLTYPIKKNKFPFVEIWKSEEVCDNKRSFIVEDAIYCSDSISKLKELKSQYKINQSSELINESIRIIVEENIVYSFSNEYDIYYKQFI